MYDDIGICGSLTSIEIVPTHTNVQSLNLPISSNQITLKICQMFALGLKT